MFGVDDVIDIVFEEGTTVIFLGVGVIIDGLIDIVFRSTDLI